MKKDDKHDEDGTSNIQITYELIMDNNANGKNWSFKFLEDSGNLFV